MLNINLKNKRNTQSGMAVIEMIPILIVVVLLINFSIGFFGVVHTGVLNTISARNYIFETFKNRNNLEFHRDNSMNYKSLGNRFSGIISENSSPGDNWIPTPRRLSWVEFFGGKSKTGQSLNQEPVKGQASVHNQSVPRLGDRGDRNQSTEVYNVWIRTLYGMCLDAQCGGN